MKKAFFYFILIYPFILSNNALSRLENQPLNMVFSFFFFLPREIRFLEIAVLFFFFFYALVIYGSDLKSFIALLSIIIIAIIGGLVGHSSISDIFQGVLIFLGPLMVYYIAYNFKYSIAHAQKYLNAFNVIVILCIPFILYQYFIIRPIGIRNPGLFNSGDSVVGLFSDAHTYATFMFFIYFYYLYLFFQNKNKKDIKKAAIFFILGFIGQNEKATLIVILFTIFIFLKEYKVKKYIIALSAIIGIAFAGIFYYQSARNNPDYKNLEDVGVVVSYMNLPDVLSENSIIPVLGAGSGNYGSPIVFRRYYSSNILPPLAMKYNYETITASDLMRGFDWTTNLITAFIVEFGIVSFVIFIFFIMNIMRKLSTESDMSLHAYKGYCRASIALLLILSAVSNLYGWSEAVLSYPVFFITGIINSYEKHVS